MPTGIYKRTPKYGADVSARQAGELNHSWGKVGELSHRWIGDDAGYGPMHYRARKLLIGQPCAHEDETCKGRLEVVFNHNTFKEFVRVDVRGTFSTQVRDYLMMCTSHHRRYDQRFPERTIVHEPRHRVRTDI